VDHLAWIVDASTRTPLAEDEIRQHMAPALVAAINPTLAALGPLTLVRKVSATQAVVRVAGQDHLLRLQVDEQGLVDNVDLNVDEPPISWPELDDRLAALGARASFAAATVVAGQSEIVHGRDADVQRPIGSGFKLYVLGALAQAVADGKAAWDEPLAIRDDWRSPFSRILETRPTGTELTLAEHADAMMWVSDNTATDHLIHHLGRDAVQRQFALFGHDRPDTNNPLLTTKEFFQRKVGGAEPLDPRVTWSEPRDIDEVEYFASAADVCRAYAGLLAMDQPEIGRALGKADEGLNLDASLFTTVWFKPGRETGVQSQNYLARTADGRAFAVSLLVSDPLVAFDINDMTARGLSVIRHAFGLLSPL